ncbi:MAG: amidohydrolase [Cyclobacteriaceae bacterium]|nr:amidohydrolase [Cyclobacteriaceae bacterium]
MYHWQPSQSRRQFLGTVAALSLTSFYKPAPALILHHGRFHTMDDDNSLAEAIAIRDGRIMAVGSNDEILDLADGQTRKVDLGGKTVLPGFIDAHSHPGVSGVQHLFSIDCDLRSIAAIQQAIREKAARTPEGEWITGFKFDDTKTIEGRTLTLKDLDDASPRHPVIVQHRGGHTSYVNALAFRLAGITNDTPDPRGGKFDRDPATGKHTGKVSESANEVFDKLIPSRITRSDMRAGVKLISEKMVKTGVTSVHDAYGTPDFLRAYQDARDNGDLGLRINCMIGYTFLDDMIRAGVRTGMGDEWVRVGGVKLTCDGSISERTARLSQPYVGRPNDFGIVVMDEEQLYPYAHKAHENDWQIGIHANGDVGIDITLRLYERLQREYTRKDPRFRIEHCTLINDDLVKRMKALGVIPTPFSTYVYYHGEKMKEYGSDRLNHMFALRTFLDAGIRPTQASDYPPGPFEPMMALQSSVTRKDIRGNVWGPNQKVTVDEAIRIGTRFGAYASGEEHVKGTLEAGKVADLVVLGRDPYLENPDTLVSIPIERTMTGGRWVFES